MGQPPCKASTIGFGYGCKASPGQMHVWCYNHVLNLVISDVLKTPISTATMFSLMNNLAVCLRNTINV